MKGAAEEAFFTALAMIKGQVDGRSGPQPCDLSGTAPGRPTASDIIDQLEADVQRPMPTAARDAVLNSYVAAYNKVGDSAQPK